MPQEAPWSGLRQALHPPLQPTLTVKVPPLTFPISHPSWGQLGPCSDPLRKDHPVDSPMAFSQSVSQSVCLPPSLSQ